MRGKIKSLLTLTLLGVMGVCLGGCGSSKPSEGYFTLSEVREGEETVKEKDLDDYGLEDAYIVVDKKGNGYAVLFGVPVQFECNEKEGTLTFDTGDVAYAASGKEITLSDQNISMTFKKSKEDAPEEPYAVALADYAFAGEQGGIDKSDVGNPGKKPGAHQLGGDPETDGPDFGETESVNPEEFFAGDWYGWWTIENTQTDFWDQLNGETFDIMAEVKVNGTGEGTLTLWDLKYTDPIAKADVSFSETDGTMISESGTFMDDKIGNSDWIISPGNYEDYMQIAAPCNDADGNHIFDYVIHLKKWGASWDDFGLYPPSYEWYQELVDGGNSMPDAVPE